MTRKRRAVLSYDPDLIDRWQAARSAHKLACDAVKEHSKQLRGLSVHDLVTFFREHPEFSGERKRLEAIERQAYAAYLQTERSLQSFERNAKRQRAQHPALKFLETDAFRKKLECEVRNFCKLQDLKLFYVPDLKQNATVFLLERLPDYSPGAASVKTWIFAKPKGLLYSFLRTFTRTDEFAAWKTPSGDDEAGISDEDGNSLTVAEAAENELARHDASEPDPDLSDVRVENLIRALIHNCKVSPRDAAVWRCRYRLDDPYSRSPEEHHTVAERFGLSVDNVRKIVSRTNDAIKSDLSSLGLREPSGKHIDEGEADPVIGNEYYRARSRYNAWERQRAEFWCEIRGEDEKLKNAA